MFGYVYSWLCIGCYVVYETGAELANNWVYALSVLEKTENDPAAARGQLIPIGQVLRRSQEADGACQ